VDDRRVWRVAPATLAVVIVFVVLAATAVPALAYLVWTDQRAWLVPTLLGALSLLALLYAWRFGLHPRLRADATGVTVVNPFSTSRFTWAELRVIAPGENGLVIASPSQRAEAWCVQKSNYATRRGRLTRADRITAELFGLLEQHDPPLEDEETGLRIRRARPDESRVLTRLERAASEDALGHIFPPEEYPYPVTEITRRWRRLLRDPRIRVHVLERDTEPVGFVAFEATRIRHLGVLPDHARRGYGSALLDFATEEIFAGGAAIAELWVLVGNAGARAFYATQHWRETGERRDCEYPPEPPEMRLVKANPSPPQRAPR
jgi:ribosomal protein S18 acetylase RimI-like enzyme